MNAQQLMGELMALAHKQMDDTVDTLKAGDSMREVHRIATCFIATPQVIREAAAWQADLLITHEPTFYNHRDILAENLKDEVTAKKIALLKDTGMTAWRLHDYIHSWNPDGITEGVLSKLNWPIKPAGDFAWQLQTPMTGAEMQQSLSKNLEAGFVRAAGSMDTPISTFALLVGACPHEYQWQAITHPEVQALLVGEVCEWMVCEYARDATQMGIPKTVLVLGHADSEKAGMEYLAQKMQTQYPALVWKYFDCGPVFQHTKTE